MENSLFAFTLAALIAAGVVAAQPVAAQPVGATPAAHHEVSGDQPLAPRQVAARA